MKSFFWIIFISIATYWVAKPFGQAEAKREIAKANVIQAQHTTQSVNSNSSEEDARKIVQAYRKRGIPRKASEEFNVIGADAVGTQVVLTYEVSAPAVIPITNQLIAEMRTEATQNFRSSEFCTNSVFRTLLQKGMTIVHNYRLYRSPNNLLSVRLSIREC
jgi:hypothetical protein